VGPGDAGMGPLRSVVTRGGVKVTYLASGEGPRQIILLHGWASNPWIWDHFMESAPKEQYTVIAMDYFGDSDRPWGGSTASGVADQVRDLMDALNIERAVVGGHSLGGITSQLFALRYQERLDGLILTGTGPTTRNHGLLPDMFAAITAGKTDRESLSSLVAGGYGTLPPRDRFERYIDHVMKVSADRLIDAMASGMQYDFIPLLRYITVPTLVLHGNHDKGRTNFHLEAFRNGLPAARIDTFECGHYVMEELPDEFDRAVLDFLDEHGNYHRALIAGTAN